MPTYVYRRADGTTFDQFQKMSDDALTQDPETGEPVTRVISGGAGLQFKGDGFYLTDYVHTGQKDRVKGEGAEAKAAKGESATTDAPTPKASSSDSKKADAPKKAAPAKAAKASEK